MPRRIRPLVALALVLPALRADAEQGQCAVTTYVWELQLVQVAAEAGAPDLRAVADALGTRAELRGGVLDPGRPKQPVRVELVGSSDGLGLSLSLQSVP